MPISIGVPGAGVDDTVGAGVETDIICIGVGVGVGAMEVHSAVRGMEEPDRTGVVAGAQGVVLAILQDKVEGRG